MSSGETTARTFGLEKTLKKILATVKKMKRMNEGVGIKDELLDYYSYD